MFLIIFSTWQVLYTEHMCSDLHGLVNMKERWKSIFALYLIIFEIAHFLNILFYVQLPKSKRILNQNTFEWECLSESRYSYVIILNLNEKQSSCWKRNQFISRKIIYKCIVFWCLCIHLAILPFYIHFLLPPFFSVHKRLILKCHVVLFVTWLCLLAIFRQ